MLWKDIVDKTAIFVARNGQEFEARIYQNEIKNPKFNFLNPSDPYHNYYKHKVKEFSEGKGQFLQSSASLRAKLDFNLNLDKWGCLSRLLSYLLY